jgi:uncharacterized protein
MARPQIFRSEHFREGRWRNGLGLSWDIASDSDSADFGWRLAIARIDGDVAFSDYPGIDRAFTLIDGDGLELSVEGLGTLNVAERFVPQFFPGDAATYCRLRGGACRALNLFVRRAAFAAGVAVRDVHGAARAGHRGLALGFVLRGEVVLDGVPLRRGDAALLDEPGEVSAAEPALYYEALLRAGPR